MYDRTLTQQKIEETSKSLNQPIYQYDPKYIDQVVGHLESLTIRDDKGRFKELKRALLPDEQLFIKNERLLCALDYDHWSENYHYIRDSNTQEMVRFKRNFAQQAMNQVYCEMELANRPIMIQSLKARQLGVTTDSTSRGQHRAQFVPNTSGVLASSDEDKTWKLTEMIQRSLRLQPWWLIPDDWKQYASGEVFVESPSRNMTLGIQHGRQTSGISRGDTINYYHLSEIPDFDNPDALIDASLMKAMHPTNMTFGILESTANGRNDYWHKRWLDNLNNYHRGLSLECPVFLPWYLGRDIYPTVGWLSGIPVPQDWTPPEFIQAHATKAREYVLENKILWQALGLGWRMPLEQMWYYYIEYQKAKNKDEAALAKFYSEMPANDREAFQSQHGSVFSIELTQDYQDKAKAPIGIYGIRGEKIPSVFWPEETEIDYEKEPIRIVYPIPNSEGNTFSWELVPVKSIPKNGLDRLIIWEMPKKSFEYGVGLDGAEGKGLDRTVLPVARKGTPTSPAVQVAELVTDKVGTLEIWPVWLMLLKFYSPVWNGDYTWALAAPEMNRGGDAALMQLINYNYPNYFIRHNLDNYQKAYSPKRGWETTPKTRDHLVQWILMIIKGHWAEINSIYLIDELRDFVVKELQTKIRLEAGSGSHDDRIFAFIILLVCLQGVDIYRAETPHWRKVQEDISELMIFPRSTGLFLPTSESGDFTDGAKVGYFDYED